MRRAPYSVVLFDEIEKAHPDIFNMLLQILDDGILTDSQGRQVSFKNTIIIMTSNIGARLITDKKTTFGFGASDDSEEADYEKIKSTVLEELKKQFRPEFLNRVDDIIVFRKLSEDEIKEIAAKMLDSLKKRVAALGIELEIDDSAVAAIASEGYDATYGARPLRRAITGRIEDKLSEKILDLGAGNISKLVCSFENGEFVFN